MVYNQWQIQDFPQGGAPTPKIAIIFQIFAENCMKMKEFGPPGGARPWRPLRSANDNARGGRFEQCYFNEGHFTLCPSQFTVAVALASTHIWNKMLKI